MLLFVSYSSSNIIVTRHSRRALKIILSIHFILYDAALFFPRLRKYLYVYRQKSAVTQRDLFIFFFFFIIRLSLILRNLSPWNAEKNTSAYNTPRTFGRLSLSRGRESCSSRLSQNSIRIIVAIATTRPMPCEIKFVQTEPSILSSG